MTSKIDEGGFAFPTTAITTPDGRVLAGASDGMSLRDWFAGQALVGLLASGQWHNSTMQNGFAEHIANHADEIADAMIAARKGGA